MLRAWPGCAPDHGIGTTAIGPQRAPEVMTGPVPRSSLHADATLEDLAALAAALRAGRPPTRTRAWVGGRRVPLARRARRPPTTGPRGEER